MKLLLCLECDDVFNLDYKIKTCQCGETKGKYIDSLNAVYQGEHAVPLGFDNFSFARAINNQPEFSPGEKFVAFIIEKECPTFEKLEEED